MNFVNWQYCNDFNDINKAIKNQNEDWEGLTSADDIISITYDTNNGCYIVFWRMKRVDIKLIRPVDAGRGDLFV